MNVYKRKVHYANENVNFFSRNQRSRKYSHIKAAYLHDTHTCLYLQNNNCFGMIFIGQVHCHVIYNLVFADFYSFFN